MADTIRVLYVDDEPGLLEIGKVFLEMTGDFSVTTIGSASAALDLLKTERYDAIISDYQMPGIDGLEFLKQVRLRHDQIPFILFTGKGREEVVILALNSGADYYLQKGGNMQAQFAELSHKIRTAVERHTTRMAFQESEEKFRVLANNSPVGIAIYQGTGVVYVNDYIALMTGYRKDELYAMNFWDIAPPDSRALFRERGLARQQGADVPSMYEIQYITKPGETRWAYLSAGSITFDGKPAGVVMLLDITDRKRAEDKLQASYEQLAATDEELREQYTTLQESQQQIRSREEDYRSILENIQDVYYRSNATGNLVLASPSLASLLGYSSVSELYGKSIAETLYYHPEDRDKILADIQKDGAVTNYEVTFKKKDGGPVIVSTSTHKYYDADGNFLGVEGIFRDITDKKQAEESLKKSENLYRAIFNNTGTATIIIAPDTTILLANTGWERLTRVPRKEQENKKSWTVFIHKDDVGRMRQYHYARRSDPAFAPKVYECRLIDAQKNVHHCFVYVDMIPGSENSVASLVDITSRVQAEDLYQTVFENTGTAMVILDEDTTISHVNEEMVTIWGYSREEIEGRMKWPNLIAAEDRQKMLEYHRLRRTGPGSAPKNYEFRFVHKNGEVRHASLAAAMIPGTKKSVISIRDITEQKKTESALVKSESIFRQLEEQLPDFVIIHEGETITFVNAEGAHLMGKTPDQIIGTSVLSYAAPEYHELIRKNTRLRYQGIAIKPYEIEIIVPSGERRWVVVRASRIPNRDSPATLTVLTDITERRRAEDALKASEAEYRAIIENMQDLFYRTDMEGTIIMVSPTGIGQAAYSSPDLLIGKNAARDLYANPKEREQFLAVLAEKGRVDNYPVTLKGGDGTLRYATASSHYYYDAQGRVLGVEGVLHDITERLRAEDALKESEEKYRFLLDESSDPTFSFYPDGTYRYVNRAFAEGVNKPVDQIIGKKIWDVFEKDEAEKRFSALRTVFSTGESKEIEVRVPRPDGDRYYMTTIVPVRDDNGSVVSAICTSKDITARRRMEEALRQANKKLNLLSGITRHDINNQLTTLTGFLALMEAKQSDPALNEYCRKAVLAAEQISSMIRFTKEYEEIGVADPAWQEIRALVEIAAKETLPGRIRLKNDLPAGMEVFADPLIGRVFFNLIDNAARYGGRIKPIRFSAASRNGDQVIVCEDDGAGVAAEEKERIFLRGFGKNTGMGLALSREILDITGITISETGDPRKGARFEITVPRGAYRNEAPVRRE